MTEPKYVLVVDDPRSIDGGRTTAHGPFDTEVDAEQFMFEVVAEAVVQMTDVEPFYAVTAIYPATVEAVIDEHNIQP